MPIHISVKPSLRMFSLWLGESIQASNISFDVTLGISSGNQMELMSEYETAIANEEFKV